MAEDDVIAKTYDDIRRFIQISNDLVPELLLDISENQLLLNLDPDNQTYRRNLIRAVCSTCEGLGYYLKNTAWGYDLLGSLFMGTDKKLSNDDLQLINEVELSLSDKGKPKQGKRKIRTLPNFRFAIRVFEKVFEADLGLNFGGNGFEELQRVFEVRDRITHPKNLLDLRIADRDIADAAIAKEWLLGLTESSLRLTDTRLNEWLVSQVSQSDFDEITQDTIDTFFDATGIRIDREELLETLQKAKQEVGGSEPE